MHMGHVLSYTYFDIVARYKRMNGFEVLYPQGWDSQGFPTEVKVEKKFGRLPREEFRKRCVEFSWEMIGRMREQMKSVGFSPDWSLEYVTMTPEYHAVVQRSVIEMYGRGEVYRADHPVLWCTHCMSAIAKSETNDKDEETAIFQFPFSLPGKEVLVASTRPEFLHACVALMVHPDDARYKGLAGKTAKTPFGKEVPIIDDSEVDMSFGTGAVMLCTYGDKQDVMWQKRYGLPIVKAITESGKVINSPFYDGLNTRDARKKVLEWLGQHSMLGESKPLRHTIKVHDRCDHAVEMMLSKEWFANVREKGDEIRKMASEIRWFPDFGIHYLTDWLDMIDWDWVISRDRVFGTPIPFYVCEKCGATEPAPDAEIPFDPDRAKGMKCPKCGAAMKPEPKVFDVWIDSSITPLIVSGWKRDSELFKVAYPASLRPQGVEIVRTWAFYTIYRSGVALTGKKPWNDILLNGNVLSPDGRKMSKSLGNIIDPSELMKEYPADAIRGWAAMSGAMAKDRPFSYEDIKYAKQFLNKFWNASKLVELSIEGYKGEQFTIGELRAVDRWLLSRLSSVSRQVTEAYEAYDFRAAVSALMQFFWNELCDYYLEYAKYRIYENAEKEKCQYVLHTALYSCCKLMFPIFPHITEEIYREVFKSPEGVSLQKTAWPVLSFDDRKAEEAAESANEIMRQIREHKSGKGLSMKDEIKKIRITTKEDISEFVEDLKKTGRLAEVELVKGEETKIEV
jgi:valyl-tRNA synthetase